MLHSLVGQIISLSPVCGNITRLMTRHCQMKIADATDEDELITLDEFCVSEIEFWKENVRSLNVRHIFKCNKMNKIICCDASSSGSGAIVCNDIHTAHTHWDEHEAIYF